jgi:hypothetical protein
MSAEISIGNITPVDSFAPKISAINGTIASPSPLSPAFAIPIIKAQRMNRIKYPGDSAGCIECRKEDIRY